MNKYFVERSEVFDQILPQIFLKKDSKIDLYQNFYVILGNGSILRMYPARDLKAQDFSWIADDVKDNWFLRAKQINNDEMSYFVFLDSSNNTAIISKPFFNSSNNEILGS